MRLAICLIALMSAAAVYAQGIYGGPAITGIPTVGAGVPNAGSPDGFSYFGMITGDINTGMTPVATDANGNPQSLGYVYGYDVGFGIQGHHRGRRYQVGLSYAGGYREYNTHWYGNGFEHSLAFDTQYLISSKWEWVTTSRAGRSQRPIGTYWGYTGINDPNRPNIPVNEIYDSPFYFIDHQENATYRASARLFLGFGGNFAEVRRSNPALFSMTAYGAQGVAGYRVGRRTTVSLIYAYMRYDYNQHYGGSVINQLMLQLSQQLSRRWTLNLGGGAFYVETTGEIGVKADPAVLALFGNIPLIETFHTSRVYGAGRMELQGAYRHYRITASFGRQPSPGNGVYATSVTDSGNAGITYNGFRKVSFGANVYVYSYESVAQKNLGRYLNYGVGANANWQIVRHLSASASVYARKLNINQTGGYSNVGTFASIGLHYTSGEHPVSIF